MGSFLASLLGSAGLKTLVEAFAGPVEAIFHDYIAGKISKEQLQEQIQAALVSAFAQVESQFLDSITKTYATFMQAAVQSPVMIRAWAVVLYTQLAVLLWHQVGIPAIVALGIVTEYPSSGMTVEWSYAIIGLCIGAPAIASRVGSGVSSLADNLKSLIGGSK